jgi:hypothetical protein
MTRNRTTWLLVSAVAGLSAALAGAASALDTTRLVEIISIFAGAFGAGAALVSAVYERRATQAPPPA